jgi:hypothetical protein
MPVIRLFAAAAQFLPKILVYYRRDGKSQHLKEILMTQPTVGKHRNAFRIEAIFRFFVDTSRTIRR